jgi:hypothetical protein
VAGTYRLTTTATIANPAAAAVCAQNPAICTAPSLELSMAPEPPIIAAERVGVRRTGERFEICVPGMTNTREVQRAYFRFLPAPGRLLEVPSDPLEAAAWFGAWFSNPASQAMGGNFLYVQEATLTGDQQSAGSFFVSLENTAGRSALVGPVSLNSAPACNPSF